MGRLRQPCQINRQGHTCPTQLQAMKKWTTLKTPTPSKTRGMSQTIYNFQYLCKYWRGFLILCVLAHAKLNVI